MRLLGSQDQVLFRFRGTGAAMNYFYLCHPPLKLITYSLVDDSHRQRHDDTDSGSHNNLHTRQVMLPVLQV